MRAVIQRVSQAEVKVDGVSIARIGAGFLTLLGVFPGDTEDTLTRLLRKIVDLRVFSDAQGKMNLSLLDVGGAHLVVSQFTLAADTSSGKRPSFTGAEKPERARELYEAALRISTAFGVPTFGGVFGADMKVSLLNDGPVTFVLDV